KGGYPVDSKGCKISCVINNEYCSRDCTSGYCYFLRWGLACWCDGVPPQR
uniref:Beta-toxin Rc1 (Fragments) n=1 Tax=Rhopalurus crassicauda TaxID=2718978 RepID=SCX1_RHOCR|nr:RecName: Full=Beta-toxin Rc1 [Rhopalurus crassicauda]